MTPRPRERDFASSRHFHREAISGPFRASWPPFPPAFGLRGEAAAANATCAGGRRRRSGGPPVVVGGRRHAGLVDHGDPPVFPCYAKGQLATGGQAPPARLVWFSFTPAVSDTYRIDTIGTTPAADYDTILGVYTGSCGSLDAVSGICRQNGFTPDDASGSLQSSVTLNPERGHDLHDRRRRHRPAERVHGRVRALEGRHPPAQRRPRGGQLPVHVRRAVGRARGRVRERPRDHERRSGGRPVPHPVSRARERRRRRTSRRSSPPPARSASRPPARARSRTSSARLFSVSSDYGAVLVQSTSRLLVGARTATTTSGGAGTFGQFTEAVDVSSGRLARPRARHRRDGLVRRGPRGRVRADEPRAREPLDRRRASVQSERARRGGNRARRREDLHGSAAHDDPEEPPQGHVRDRGRPSAWPLPSW